MALPVKRSIGLALLVVWSAALAAQTPVEAPQATDLPKGQIPDLGRPTEKGDEVPIFDYDLYFPGKWDFEWRVPESPLGPAGTIRGTEVFEPSEDGRFYRSRIEAVGPQGPFTVESVIAYESEQKVFARYEKDSRGFEILKTGRIGGDLGGFYTIHYESAPFEVGAQVVRLRMTSRLVSPVNYKVQARISVDDGPFVNYGNPWWRKEFERPKK